jgi:hypothetical protein
MFVIQELGPGKKQVVKMRFYGPKAPTGDFGTELRKVLEKYAKFQGSISYTVRSQKRSKKVGARSKARKKR